MLKLTAMLIVQMERPAVLSEWVQHKYGISEGDRQILEAMLGLYNMSKVVPTYGWKHYSTIWMVAFSPFLQFEWLAFSFINPTHSWAELVPVNVAIQKWYGVWTPQLDYIAWLSIKWYGQYFFLIFYKKVAYYFLSCHVEVKKTSNQNWTRVKY